MAANDRSWVRVTLGRVFLNMTPSTARSRMSAYGRKQPLKVEKQTFYRRDDQVPQEGFPLMSATRHALHHLNKARPRLIPRLKLEPVEIGGLA